MANDTKVNSEHVLSIAGKLDKSNKELTATFDSVDRAMVDIDQNWDGSASDCAMAKFKELRTSFIENREKTFDNYIRFLKDVVANGAEIVEEANTSLADQFI